MQKIPFNINRAEREIGVAVRRAIEGSNYTVSPRVKVKYVIGRQENDHLDRNEEKAFEDAEFDYVVFEENYLPVFTLEYDGPVHEKPEKKRSDARKNGWCTEAGLPLLRISDWEIAPEDRDLFVTYLIKRYLAYQEEFPVIRDGIIKKYGLKKIERRYAEGLIPWDMDPYRVFDLRHPIPGFNSLLKKIAEDFKMFVVFVPPSKTILLEKRDVSRFGFIPVELGTETEEIEIGHAGITRCIINGGRLFGESEGTKTTYNCWWYVIKLSGLGEYGGYSYSDAGGPISVSGAYEVIKQSNVSLRLDTIVSPRETSGETPVYTGLPGSEFFFVSNRFTCYLAAKAAYEWLSENELILRGR